MMRPADVERASSAVNIGQDTERQAVQHDRLTRRYGRQKRSRRRLGSSSRRGKAFPDIEIVDIQPNCRSSKDPPVVSVAARWRVETARTRENDAPHHNGAS